MTQGPIQSGVTFVVDGEGRTQERLLVMLNEAGLQALSFGDMWTCIAVGVEPLEEVAVAVYLPKRAGASTIERAVSQRQGGWGGESVVVWPMIPDTSLALRWPWAEFVGVEPTQSQEVLLEAVLKQCKAVAGRYLAEGTRVGGRGLDAEVGLSTFSLDGRARAA